MEHKRWHGETQSSGQGLIYNEETGESIAVAYSSGDAEQIAKDHNVAPKLLEALQKISLLDWTASPQEVGEYLILAVCIAEAAIQEATDV